MTVKTGADLVAEAKERIKQVSPADAMHARDDKTVFLDVREPNEWNLAHVPGALHLPRGNLESKVEGMIPRDKKVVIYCASGNRSALAADTMQQMGYTDVASLSGGFRGWADSGGQVES
ncbi:MAG: rhodanese-like domain-containing protein [Gemmatimonadaceae bacterium]